MEILKEDWNA